MFEKLKSLFPLRYKPKLAPQDALVKQLTEQGELAADHLTPAEASRIFDLFQNLWLDVVFRRFPNFDLEAVRVRDPETFWRLVHASVCIQRLHAPIASEVLQGWLLSYGDQLANAAFIQEQDSYGNL